MPDCYYTCNLIPLDLVARNGYSPRWLGNHLRDGDAPARREALSIHPMTCPFVTKLVAAADELLADGVAGDGDDRLVVAGGCDAMRRMGDLLAATHPERTFVLPMPRSSGPEVEHRLAADLRRLDEWLAPVGSAADRGGATGASTAVPADPPTVDYPEPPRPGGVFLVAGPLSDDSLLRLIGRLGSHVSGLDSCTSPDRWKPLAPTSGEVATSQTASPSLDYAALAARALEAGMCPRRSTGQRRDHLVRRLDETRPTSIIYARQSFCDPGAYDALLVAALAAERHLPYLEIEVDFPFDANGPLHTRVEAFLEAQLLDDDLLGDLGEDDLFSEKG
jgi:hypothetical protein